MISVFLPYGGYDHTKKTVKELRSSKLVAKIFLLVTDESIESIEECEILYVDNFNSSSTVSKIAERTENNFTMIINQDNEFSWGQFAVERFYGVANSTNAGMVYSDYYEVKNGEKVLHPVIDYQVGSLRDDFNFGYMLLFKPGLLKSFSSKPNNYPYAGIYGLRLFTSVENEIIRIPEVLYTTTEPDTRKSGAKQFDYVDPRNREVQVDMEIACTNHLKQIGGYLSPNFIEIDLQNEKFEYEASVIIPIKNRVNTIADAITSVLSQKTKFSFNLIIVDNFSNDGTSEKIKEFMEKDERVIHLIPERNDLGIGGCWNEAIMDERCGKFAAQLDSDDIYAGDNTLQSIIDAFYEQKCGMVIGTYKMTDFNLTEIPPGIIDHKEWTSDNGRNNALRINGLGAPRAFYTPLLREIKVPNVSYGEDYAVGLAISRNYQIGRIYDPIYLCRRWEGNSDAELDIEKQNKYNIYKDRIRTIELLSRIEKNCLDK